MGARPEGETDFRQVILNAARRLFIEEGYKNLSMRKLARDIGYSATSIYLHFNNKDEMLDVLLEEAKPFLGKKLQGFRVANGDSIPDLAIRTGVNEKVIAKVENEGAEGVEIEHIKKMAKAVGAKLEWLISLQHVEGERAGSSNRLDDSSTFSIVIDPGSATPEEIGELLHEISVLYRMIGGSGITFVPTEVSTREVA